MVTRFAAPSHGTPGADDAAQQFDALVGEFGSVPFFCINDTCDDAHADLPSLRGIADVLKTLLPHPCWFELA